MKRTIDYRPPTHSIGIAMRQPNIFNVPAAHALAAPLLVRRAQFQEAGELATLLGRSFVRETWDEAGTEQELFGDETVRATLVVAAHERLVATASLQVCSDASECAWSRWVATAPEWRREGLARALVIAVIEFARTEGCREARLNTETDRLAAISLYSQLGFEPLIAGDAER